MSAGSDFVAQLKDEVRQFEGAAQAIFTDSVQELIELAQSYVPVKTSFLVNSMVMSNTSMPEVDPEKHGGDIVPATISAEIINAGYGAMVYVGYTAAYALRIEFGFVGQDSKGRTYNQPAQAFVGRAAQDWEAIVARNEARIMGQLQAA